jgi:hypothetical protein
VAVHVKYGYSEVLACHSLDRAHEAIPLFVGEKETEKDENAEKKEKNNGNQNEVFFHDESLQSGYDHMPDLITSNILTD